MPSALFLVMRRLRRPLLALIVVYAVCTAGFVAIPATDAAGQAVQLDFLHAFYVVSYTATTIGFGELPHPFNAAQRAWMLFTIYATVSVWLYAFGSIIATLQDPALAQLVARRRLKRRVLDIGRPFHLLCGYGETGELVVRELARYRMAVVVVDPSQERLDALSLQDLGIDVPALRGDASDPQVLIDAGLRHPFCRGVIALTGSDEVNLAVAMAARLLAPEVDAICGARSQETADNMASFHTRHVVNPYVAFGERLGLTLRAPSAHVVYECLTTSYRRPIDRPLVLPQGRWVVCGHGRFGKQVVQQLQAAGSEVVVVELDPTRTQAPPGSITGRGTEAVTLVAAGIRGAVGVVACTDDGINNLSIVVTARELNPQVFTVGRQTRRENSVLFRAAALDLRVRTAHLAASETVELLRNPLLPRFLDRLMQSEEAWAAALLQRMAKVIGDTSPATWVLRVEPACAPALHAAVQAGQRVPLGALARDARDRDRALPVLPLLLLRQGHAQLLPDDAQLLQPGDDLLCCGRPGAEARMLWAVSTPDALAYLLSGNEAPSGWVWRWWAARAARRAQVPQNVR